jgi:hypothetical protein
MDDVYLIKYVGKCVQLMYQVDLTSYVSDSVFSSELGNVDPFSTWRPDNTLGVFRICNLFNHAVSISDYISPQILAQHR